MTEQCAPNGRSRGKLTLLPPPIIRVDDLPREQIRRAIVTYLYGATDPEFVRPRRLRWGGRAKRSAELDLRNACAVPKPHVVRDCESLACTGSPIGIDPNALAAKQLACGQRIEGAGAPTEECSGTWPLIVKTLQ